MKREDIRQKQHSSNNLGQKLSGPCDGTVGITGGWPVELIVMVMEQHGLGVRCSTAEQERRHQLCRQQMLTLEVALEPMRE